MRRWVARGVVLLLAGFLVFREVSHLAEPFLHNPIDTFIDVFAGASALLMIANVAGFRKIVWWRTVGPCLAALLLLGVSPFRFLTPGYFLAAWAEQSPWYGHQPPVHFIDVDPWMALGADLLIFTAAISVILAIGLTIAPRRNVHVEAA